MRERWKRVSPFVRDFFHRADMLLFALSIICSVFGIVMISSATNTAEGGSFRYVAVQTIALLLGIAVFAVFTVIDVDVIASRWVILYAFSAVLILILIPFGYDDGTGNRSWLRFMGIGIQPSEVVKVIFIIVLAKHISYLKEYRSLNHVFSVFQLAVHFAVPFLMVIVISGDLGSALIFFAIFAIMIFAGGLKLYWFVLGAAAMAAVIPYAWENVLKEYQKERIIAPYVPDIDPRGDSVLYQATRSRLALASGRLTGTGLYQGPQTQSRAVPAQQTDFIFSVIGEELGMIGCYAVIVLLLLIIIRCVQVGLRSRNTMNMLVCFGVAGMMLFQTAINIGMCTGLTPVIGLTLPFFSYGGSSMIAQFAAVGLVSGIKYKPKPQLFYRAG